VRGVPFAGEHFFNEKSNHPSDCSPLSDGFVRGVGLEWVTKQIFLVEDARLLFYESIEELLPKLSVELYPTVVIEPVESNEGGSVSFHFNFGQKKFAFNLDEEVKERVEEVEQSLRLKQKYALPMIKCTLCGSQVSISEEGIVESHKCKAEVKKEESGGGCFIM
jgi:hypothetical protein